MKLSLAMIFSLLFTLTLLHAENGILVGQIVSQDKRPVADARLLLEEIDVAGYSNDSGEFRITSVPPGVYNVLIKHIGYEARYLQKVKIEPGETQDLGQIVLQEAVLPLSGTVITATRSERKTIDVPAAVNLVPREMIDARNGKTSAEVLREEGGVFVQKTNHGGGSAILRGLSSNQILLLVDGVRLNNSTYRLGNHQYLTTVDNNALEQIEVVHGPTSVLYGSDALGGTINLITRRPPLHAASAQIKARAALFGRFASADEEKTGRGEIALYNHRWALLAGFSRKHFGDLRRGGNSDDPEIENSTNGLRQSPSGFDGYDADAKLVFVPSPHSELLLAYQQFHQGEVPRYDKYESGDNSLWLYSPQNRNLAYGKFTQHLRSPVWKQLQFTVSLNRQEEGRITQKQPDDEIVRELDEVNSYGFTAQAVAEYRDHQISFGGDVYLDDVASGRWLEDPQNGGRNADARGRFPDGAAYRSFGAYVQDEWQVSQRWMLLPGLRYSYFQTDFALPASVLGGIDLGKVDLSFSALTASVGTVYKISPSLSLAANAGQAFRAPNLSDLSKLGESKGTTFEIPNTGLKPEKLFSLDAGIRWHHPALRGSLVGYYAAVRDLLGRVPVTINGAETIIAAGDTLQVRTRENIGEAYLGGFEFAFDARINQPLHIFANAAYTYGQNSSADEPISKIPPLFGLLGVRYHHGSWNAELYSRFAARQNRLSADDLDDPRIPNSGTPGWHTINLRGRYHPIAGVSLSLALENLLDKNYREHGSGINGPGRNLVISVRIQR